MALAPHRRIHRLIYASRITDEAAADLDHVLREILIAAMNNNRAASITGLLIAHDGWFLQALEGPRPAVEETFARIERDSRHHSPTALTVGAASNRAFQRWSMCARSLSDVDSVILERLGLRGSFNPMNNPERWALQLLSTVAAVHERTLDAQQIVLPTVDRPAA
jgi:hypothetical protein